MTPHTYEGERPAAAHDGLRPLLFLDVEIGAADRAWVAARHAGSALLHRVDHRRGLTGTG
ncbi:hypothetical protein [Streptomyces sp. LMG1-1-1.1]|uniref:hypothetical protein n=1 Tax=Streptomyces sp. LMG1-1-1.1 TaxID=3135245 RepID=UPI0034652F8B